MVTRNQENPQIVWVVQGYYTNLDNLPNASNEDNHHWKTASKYQNRTISETTVLYSNSELNLGGKSKGYKCFKLCVMEEEKEKKNI